MKKVLSIVLSLVFCITAALPAIHIAAGSEALVATSLFDKLNMTVGDDLSSLMHAMGNGNTATAVDSPVSYSSVPAIELNNSAAQKVVVNTNNFAIKFPVTNLTDGKSLLLYVKTPKGSAHQMYILMSTKVWEGSAYDWPRLRADKSYSVLKEGTDAWVDKTTTPYSAGDPDGLINLDDGFEGYVRVPLESIGWTNADSTLTSSSNFNQFHLRFSNYGGDMGSITAGPLMLVTNDATGTTIKLDGGAEAEMLHEAKPAEEYLTATEILNNTKVAVGEDMVKAGAALADSSAGVTLTATNSPVAYSSSPAAVIDCAHAVDLGSNKAVAYDNNNYALLKMNASMAGASALMFYVKMPSGDNRLFLVASTNPDENGTPTSWPRVQSGSAYQLLKKGTTSWIDKTAAEVNTGAEEGLLEFEGGFEGYVKIPLSSIDWKGNNAQVNEGTTIVQLQFRFSHFGGDLGSITIGPLLKVTKDINMAQACLNGATLPTDLFAASTVDADAPLLNFQTISDTHVDDYGGGSVSIGARFMQDGLKDIAANHPDTDAILHCGDITEIATPAQYAQAFGYFTQYAPTTNILSVMGNHDIRGNLSTEANVDYQTMVDRYLAESSKFITGQTKPYYDMWINGYHFIALCTDEKLKDEATISEEQLNWFKMKVKEGANDNKPIFVLLHDPLEGTFTTNKVNTTQPSEELLNFIKKYPQIIVFSGHMHSAVSADMIKSEGEGIFVNCPSMHNDNRGKYPNDENSPHYYNVNVYSDHVEIALYNFKDKKNVFEFSINTDEFGKKAAEEPEVKDPVMKAEVVPTLPGLPEDGTISQTQVIPHYAAGETATAVMGTADPLTALSTDPCLKIDSEQEIVRNGIDSQTQFDLQFNSASLKNGKGLLLYVKMPEGDDGSGTNQVFFNVATVDAGGGDAQWSRFWEGHFNQYLAKGTNKWVSVAADKNGETTLPAGFEGYIYAPFESIVSDTTFKGLDEDRYIWYMGFSFGYVGGKYGPGYIYPVLKATNDTLSKDGVIMNNDGIIRNLFTGVEMKQEDVVEDENAAPDVGSITDTLPEATTDKTIHPVADSDITESSVKLSWDAFDSAAKYRVDVYRSTFGSAGLQYEYTGNQIVEGTTCTVTGLKASTRYYFVVVPLAADGAVLGYYDSVSVQTVFASPTKDNTTTTTANGGSSNKTDTPATGTALPIAAAVMAAGATVALVATKHRKQH